MRLQRITLLILLISIFTSTSATTAQSAGPIPSLANPSDAEPAQVQTSADWYMAGANPQRTSWVSAEVRGDLKPLWYTPIQPYINPRVQVIATGGRLYVATTKGLYAYHPDTGAQLWVYPTKFPIAASPTVIGSTAYIGVFDRHIHAVNASTGQPLWISAQAGAGFDTSPLVINNKVIAGNRDGYMYAFDTTTGGLLWKYRTDGPILFSAAYYDGKIYFVSSDMHAYALNESGGLVWKSAALPGSGFNSWWPVVYQAQGTDRSKDRIIISGGWNYREDMAPESYSKFTEMESKDAFPPGKQTSGAIITYSEIISYFTSKPYRKTTIVLNPQTGAEMEIAPALYSWTTTGSRYPAMVGSDGRIYQQAVHTYRQWIPGASLISWKPGESSFIRSDDVGYSTPSDEPMYLALGGNVAYFGICCDRYAMAFDTTNHAQSWTYWAYNLNSRFPGYSLYYQRPNCPDDCYGRNNISTHFGTRNGAYGIHGEGNPPIPYNGKVYLHRGNTLLAFAPSASTVIKNPKSMIVPTTADPIQAQGATSLQSKLAEEVQKMLDAGHLRKPYLNQRKLYCINTEMEYWQNSAMTIYVLLRALPHLPVSMQPAVRQYIQTEYNTYKPYQVSNEGFVGAPREYHSTPPDALQVLNNSGSAGGTTLFTHYASWKYAQAFGNSATVYNNIKDRLPSPPSNTELLNNPYKHNEFIAGYWGFLELQKLATGSESTSVRNTLNNLITLRTNNFTNRSVYADMWESSDGAGPTCNQLNIASNFLYLVPELADILRTNNLSQVQAAITEDDFNAPFWFVAFTRNGLEEATLTPLYDVNAVFQAKALILRTPASELEDYLDVSAFRVGDLYYILNLATVLDLSSAPTPPGQSFTPTPAVQATASSTPTNPSIATPAASQTPTNPAPPAGPTPTSGAPGMILISNPSEFASVAKYDKQEITFNINTSATNLQWPYDPAAPAGINGSTGISVEAVFTSPSGKVWVQPGFFYEIFDDQIKDGTAWFYPTGQAVWKVRFSPDEEGMWQYYLKAQDKTGVTQSGTRPFTVTASSNHGFIRASQLDPRYFEFSDGTYFPALGFNAAYNEIQWTNPYANQDYFQKAGSNGIQVIRTWLTYWSIFGSTWNPWYPIRNDYDGYLPRSGLYVNGVNSTPTATLRLMYGDNNSHYWFDACRFIGGFQAPPAVKQNTKYHIQIKYKAQGITGPRNPSFPGFGFVAKVQNPNVGAWHTTCYDGGDPQNGVKVTSYGTDSANWTYLEGEWNSGTRNSLPMLYLALENVRSQTNPEVDIDTVFIGEDFGGGKYGPNIVTKASMEQLSYFMERNAYAFDKVLDLAAQNAVYLKLVVMEKNELMENELDFAGNRAEFDNNNFYGNYRTMTPVRWYQQAWWRYLQARWGYSPNIFAFEAVNEAAPAYTNHYGQVDEMGKYLHCGVFGVAVPPLDGHDCNLSHPNAHMVSTSFWSGFENGLFASNKYPNVDYADIHQYIPKDTDPVHFQDTALSTYDLGRYVGALQSGSGKPVIRGETGLISQEASTDSAADVSADTQGIWLHHLIWGGINPTGLIEHYWYAKQHIYNNVDLRNHFKNYYLFIKDIPLNNGKYVDAAAVVSDARLRAWGQKDLTNQSAHLWIADTDHVWTNKNPITPINGTVIVTGLAASTSFNVEWWDTYAGTGSSTQLLATNSNGELILTISNLSTDVAVRIARQATFPAPTSPAPASTPTTQAPTTDPNVMTQVEPASLNVGETGLVSVSLNNIPVEGYKSAEFTCTYNPGLVEKSNIVASTLFGADSAVAIHDPQNGSFIVAVSGTNSNRAMTSGPAFTFNVKGLQAGQSVLQCTARVSKGDNVPIDLPSSGASLTIPDVLSSPTPFGTPESLPTDSTQPTATNMPIESPTPMPPQDGTVSGQVIAGKLVTVSLYDASNTVITTVVANPDGTFSLTALAGTYRLVATASGYLSHEGSVILTGGNITVLPASSLLAGDVDGNNVIDQFDALTIGMSYTTAAPSAADLNNEGVIDFLDLELLAENYRQTGPVVWE